MLNLLLEFAIRQRAVVLLGALGLLAAGAYALLHLPVDAVPDLTGPQVQVNVNVQAQQMQGDVYEVVLTLNAEAKLGADPLFIVELVYGGVFTVQGVPTDILRPLLLIECPRLLFPFARGIIASLTREGGLPPMLIQPIDFADLYRRQLQAAGQQAPGNA